MRDHPAQARESDSPTLIPEPTKASPRQEWAVDVADLTVAYDAGPVLYDVDVQLPPGTMTAIVGPNGAGKTTLLRSLLGLVKPAAGTLRLLGQPIRDARGSVAYVPQRTAVDWEFPATVFDVALMGTYGRLGWFRRPGTRERQQAMEALRLVGLDQLAQRPIGELSGGQQQRTFVARALVQQAPLILLDEPFAGVDAVTERAIVTLLQNLRDRGTTVVAVHHDLHTVREYFDWVVMLNRRAVAVGPVADVFHDGNLRSTFGGRVGTLGGVALPADSAP